MGIKIEGALGVEEMLLRMDTTTKRRVVRKLVEKGRELKLLAIAMAPVDEGNLEAAIKMTPEDGGFGQERQRDGAGRFVRTEVEIYVDMDMVVPHRPKKTVGDYAYEMHEHLTPMGWMQLGPKSAAKHSGARVGGGFMTRAADQIEQGLDAALREALDGLI